MYYILKPIYYDETCKTCDYRLATIVLRYKFSLTAHALLFKALRVSTNISV